MRKQDPIVCFLMETRLEKEGFEKLYKDLLFQNRIIVKQPDERGGCIVVEIRCEYRPRELLA